MTQNDLPEFEQAVESFRTVLAKNSLPASIWWVFRDDTWFATFDKLVVRSKPPERNAFLAAKVYKEGRTKGLVEIAAVGHVESHTLATVWFPKFAEDEVQGWSAGLKLSIRQPCPRAKALGPFGWTLLRWRPAFRRYQRDYGFIGTTKWAAG